MKKSSPFPAGLALLRSAVALSSLVLASMLGLSSGALAQTTTGSVRGYVRDENGNPIAGAQIAARSTDMGVVRGATSTAEGFYNLAGLRPGIYEMSTRRIGFTAQSRTVTVQIGRTLDVNLTLASTATQLAGMTVTASQQEARTSEVATNVTQAQINDLPSTSRNFLDLASLAAGVHVTIDRIDGTGKTFAAGAQGPEQINVFIDGASYKNDIINGGVAGQDASRGNPFPRNAVQEFRITTSNFKAEYQKASSAVITAVTKSGGNEWQGSTFLNFQDQGFVALDTFTRATKNANPTTFKKPDYSRYLMGLSGGGPIIRDKLFFFGSYEGNHQVRQGITRFNGNPATWPTAVAAVNGEANDAPFQSNLLFGKLSWNRSEKQLVEFSGDARLEGEKRDFAGQFACTCSAYSTGDNFHSNVITGRAKHSYFGTNGTNEALVSYQFYRWHNESFDFNSPALDYAGIGRIGGHDAEQNLRQKRLSLRDDYTVSTRHWGGAHVPKIGANIDFVRYDMTKALNDNPTYFFDPINNFSTPVRAVVGFGDPTIATNNNQIGLYAQDDWNPTQRLTLNLGVRWDYESGMYNRDFVTPTPVRDSINAWRSQSFVPIDPNRYFTDGSNRKGFYGAIQPRVGASYALDQSERTIIYGGWGIFYDRLQYNATLDEQYRRQHQIYTFQFQNPNNPTGTPWNQSFSTRQGLINAINNGQAPPQEVYLIPNDLKPPHSNQWNVGVRHDFGLWNGSVTYNSARSFNGFSFDWGDVTFTPNRGRDCCLTHRVVNGSGQATYANILVGNNSVRTWYDAVQIQLDRPYRRADMSTWGWGAGLAWTISKAEAEGGDLFSFPQVSLNPRHPIGDDQRHTVVTNFITDVPYAWGIQFSGLVTLGSGRPFNRASSSPTQGSVVEFGAERPEKFNFIIPNAFAYRNVDLRLRKDFLAMAGNRVGVTADLFNAFNYQNYGCFDEGVASARFGQPNCVIADGRRLQLGLQYDFGRSSRR